MCMMKMTGITSIFQDNINMVSIIIIVQKSP